MMKLLVGLFLGAAVLTVAADLNYSEDAAPWAKAVMDLQANYRAADTALAASMVAYVDTNATTTATAYTPRRAGHVLLGGAGTGTNAVWIAKGTGTNDWIGPYKSVSP